MNERIRQLKEQSMEWVPNQVDPDTKIRLLNAGKFAELIVRECATTCDNIGKEARKEWKAKYIPHDDGRSDGAWECKAAILEHFGVEE